VDLPTRKAGFRVLDLAEGAAAFCSKLLADLGAEVIKVERPGGEPSRRVGPSPRDVSSRKDSFSFIYHNGGKRGITLNLNLPAGRELFLKLLPGTDVVIDSFRPGELNRLGLDYPALRKVNLRLILASITGFGQTGPRSMFKSCDLVASAYSGQMSVCGSPAMTPLKPWGEQSLYTASLFGAVAVMMARRRVADAGEGCHIDLSLQEAAVATLGQVMTRCLVEQQSIRRQGGLYGDHAFAVCPCRDGHILLTPLRNWETLVEWMAADGMAGDLQEEPWKDESYRRDHFDHILHVVQLWTRMQPVQKLFELAQLMRFPWAPVQSPKEVLRDPQLQSRDFFAEASDPGGGTMTLPGTPYRFGGVRMASTLPPPSIGEHNGEVYRQLGLTDETIAEFVSKGVL
jgi:benzylsuccinate CoA-transferase BbsE subunit